MTRNTDANCGNCPFGKENSLDPLTVDCHRYPPVYIEGVKHDDGEYDRWGFPSHAISSVCGEHPEFFNRGVAQVEEPRIEKNVIPSVNPNIAECFRFLIAKILGYEKERAILTGNNGGLLDPEVSA